MKFALTSWLILTMLYSLTGFAQMPTDFSRIIPPTPEAAALQKEVKIPLDKSTGVANISVPLFTFKNGNIEVPVSLNYHSSGIQVDQIATSVGLGWSLSAGGAIVRSIRGKVDDNDITAKTQHFVDSINNIFDYTIQDYLKGNDFTQDDYSYNFLNYSGSFYFDSTGNIHSVIKDQLRLTGIIRPAYFEASDFKGFTYHFDTTDYSIMQTWSSNNALKNPTTEGISAWRLTSIEDQKTNVVNLKYESYTTHYELLTADTYDKLIRHYSPPPGSNTDCDDGYPTVWYQTMSSHGQTASLIKQIISKDARADFYYSIDNSADASWQKRLDSITVTSLVDSVVKQRIYFSYGRFSGNNQIKLLAVSKRNVNNKRGEETRFEYYEDAALPPIGSRSRDIFGYFNGRTNQMLITTTDTDYPLPSADREVNPSTIFLGSLKRVMHPAGGSTLLIYEPNKVATSGYAAGIRVKEIDEYDPISNQLSRTAYEYYGFNGTFRYFPINMAPQNRTVSFVRKIFSSSSATYTSLIGLTSAIPSGYYYDSVVLKKKGASFDLIESNKFYGVSIFNNLRAYPSQVKTYKFNPGIKAYESTQESNTFYNTITQQEHSMPLVDIMPVEWHLYTTYPNAIVTCEQNCPGLNAGIQYTENAVLKSREENTLFANGQSITNTTRYYYSNLDHLLPTRTVKITSKDSTITITKYPAEMIAGGLDPTGIFQEMLNRGMLSNKGSEEIFDAQGNSMSKTVQEYRDNWLPTDLPTIALSAIKTGVRGTAPETRKVIDGYDLNFNIAGYAEDGLHTGILWDYKGSVPVASVKNASVYDIAYTGFETISNGGWVLQSGTPTTSAAIMGKRSFILGGSSSIIRTAGNGKDYIVSYWSLSGASITVNGSAGVTGITKRGWTYHEYFITNPSTITISGTGTIDELRAYPKGSLMTSFAHNHLVGMTETMDAANRLNIFQYDGLQRLTTVRDADSNILKRFDYHFTQEKGDTIFYNDAVSNGFSSQACGPNAAPTSVYYYSIPAGIYSSTISKAAANAMASSELYIVGQNFSNVLSQCALICPNCTGIQWRCINGTCTRGAFKATSSVYNADTGKYDCTGHYEFPDGFKSVDVPYQSDTPCQ